MLAGSRCCLFGVSGGLAEPLVGEEAPGGFTELVAEGLEALDGSDVLEALILALFGEL